MDNGRLLQFLHKLESISLGSDTRSDTDALQHVHGVVQAMKAEIASEPSSNDETSQRTSLSPPSLADTKLSVESVEAAHSGVASTVGIDIHPPKSSAAPTGLGFIDAIRLAAQSLDDQNVESPKLAQHSGPSVFKPHRDNLFAIPSSKSDSPVSISFDSGPKTAAPTPNRELSIDPSLFKTDHPSEQRSVLSDPQRSPSHPSSYTSPSSHSYNSDANPGILAASQQSPEVSQSTASSSRSKVTRRMKNFRKYFPAYRKLFRHESTHRSFLRPNSSRNYTPAISPDTRHMALVTESKFQIFGIPEEYNERPVLLFSGDIDLQRTRCFVAMNNMWLVVASRYGVLVVICLKTRKRVFHKNLRLQVTALDVSADGSYIGVAVTKQVELKQGIGSLQPMIILICTSTAISLESAFEHPDIVSFVSPYNDNIRTISFNDAETAIVCSTEQESRVFVVSLEDYREPRILLRSRRNNPDSGNGITLTDAEKQPEGITGAIFLPNNRYVLLSSCAPGAPPVILDTKLVVTRVKSHSGKILQYLNPSGQQQNVIIRFDKMGSAIQYCTASPQGNGAAFVDYSGAVFAVNFPSISTEPRKIAVVFDLAAGQTIKFAPVLRFTPDGTALIAVDRKGDVHIADFGAGHPQQPGIMKTKVLS